jgi:hypothetical protein
MMQMSVCSGGGGAEAEKEGGLEGRRGRRRRWTRAVEKGVEEGRRAEEEGQGEKVEGGRRRRWEGRKA